jgi:hypothetical protein
LSGKNCKPCWHATTSAASSGIGCGVAGDSTHSIGADDGSTGFSRAISNIAGLMSVATTRPLAPRRLASTRVTVPGPHAMSSATPPVGGSRRSTMSWANGMNIVAIRSSYTCIPRTLAFANAVLH